MDAKAVEGLAIAAERLVTARLEELEKHLANGDQEAADRARRRLQSALDAQAYLTEQMIRLSTSTQENG